MAPGEQTASRILLKALHWRPAQPGCGPHSWRTDERACEMRAIGSFEGVPVDDPNSLIDVDLPDPGLRARDVLVRGATMSAVADQER
jgi:hypothetical protein